MIKETVGKLFEAKTEALINSVNCIGVMGKGIALQFRREFSEDYFKDYKRACQNGELAIGIRFGIWEFGMRISPRLTTNPKSKI
jgi:O-acetyl-ADP-ribose deacetylase (regulator of RNase III)